MIVQNDPRMKGLPYYITKEYHRRNAILQQEVETSVVNYYEGNIRSCFSINNSIEPCLEKLIAVIQRNDIINLQLSLESALYFNLYEGKIRSCLRGMKSIEMCVQQIIVEMQRNTDDYKKATVDQYNGNIHSCLKGLNTKEKCIQNVTAETERNSFTYTSPSLETLKSDLQTLAIPIAFSEYEVKTRISMSRHYNERDGTLALY